MQRLPDWPAHMTAAIDAARGVTFGYAPGQMHCCLFSADVVLAMTGHDIYAVVRGRYRSEREAYVVLRRYGGGDVPEGVARAMADAGAPEIDPRAARRGDLVLFDTPDGPAAGICVGSALVSVTKPDGLGFLSMSVAKRAWRI